MRVCVCLILQWLVTVGTAHPSYWSYRPNHVTHFSLSVLTPSRASRALIPPPPSLHTQMHACTTTLPRVTAPLPSRSCQRASFCPDIEPRGGQRAGQTHRVLWRSVFLMALSRSVIDFNSATCHKNGKWGLCDLTAAPNSGKWPQSRSSGWKARGKRITWVPANRRHWGARAAKA